MAYLKIITNGIASTIQDNGRFFFRESGIPVSGAFDKLSAQFANILLKNKVNTPVMEFFFSGPIIKFDVDVFVSVTGANINVYIDQKQILSNDIYEEINSNIKVSNTNLISISETLTLNEQKLWIESLTKKAIDLEKFVTANSLILFYDYLGHHQ